MEILFHGRGVCRFLTRLIRVAALLWLVYLGPRPPLYTRGRRSLYKHGHRRQPLGVPWCQLVSQGDDEIFQPLPRLLVNLMLGQVFTFCKTHQHRAGRSSNEILQFFFCEINIHAIECLMHVRMEILKFYTFHELKNSRKNLEKKSVFDDCFVWNLLRATVLPV